VADDLETASVSPCGEGAGRGQDPGSATRDRAREMRHCGPPWQGREAVIVLPAEIRCKGHHIIRPRQKKKPGAGGSVRMTHQTVSPIARPNACPRDHVPMAMDPRPARGCSRDLTTQPGALYGPFVPLLRTRFHGAAAANRRVSALPHAHYPPACARRSSVFGAGNTASSSSGRAPPLALAAGWRRPCRLHRPDRPSPSWPGRG